MVTLAVVLTVNHRLLSLAAILDVFETVNRFYRENGQPSFFEINVAAEDASGAGEYGRYKPRSISDEKQYELILVPAFSEGDLKQSLEANRSLMIWLEKQYERGARIASVCTGAFLVAASGLLDGKAATTHMDAADVFAVRYPSVNLRADAVITEDRGIYTSGGATSSFHLLVHLIESYCGREMAVRTAKHFAIDMDRNHQGYFGTFRPMVAHHDELVRTLQERIKKEYAQMSSIEDLLNDIPASRRNLVRRFKQMTGNTPIGYLQKTRIEAAKKCLEQSSGGVLECMVEAGYSDLKAFRQLFKKMVGMTPSAYRSKYNRRSAA